MEKKLSWVCLGVSRMGNWETDFVRSRQAGDIGKRAYEMYKVPLKLWAPSMCEHTYWKLFTRPSLYVKFPLALSKIPLSLSLSLSLCFVYFLSRWLRFFFISFYLFKSFLLVNCITWSRHTFIYVDTFRWFNASCTSPLYLSILYICKKDDDLKRSPFSSLFLSQWQIYLCIFYIYQSLSKFNVYTE